MGGIHFETNGTISFITGTQNYGQGHASAFAQVLSDKLGIPLEAISVKQGDSDQLIVGGGTGGSRSIMASGAAIVEVSNKVIDKARKLAADILETSIEDICFQDGKLELVGTDRSISLQQLARSPKAQAGNLNCSFAIDTPPSTFPNGVHICEIEIDPETGSLLLDRYTLVDDFGVLINPQLVAGQVHGGIAQGIGQAIMEHAIFDGKGQLLSGSLMDYPISISPIIPRPQLLIP